MNDQERHPQETAGLYGPAGKADHQPGDTIRFTDPEGRGQLAGEILYVRAPGPAIQGGKSHPTTYVVFVAGEHLPRMVYPSQVVEVPLNASS